MKNNIVTIGQIFEADKKLVWKAITEKELMRQWYFDLKAFEPVVGFQFDFLGGPENGIQYHHICEITEVLPEEKLTYSWKYEGYDGISYVSFALFAEGDNTKLVLTHTGIDTFPRENADFNIANFEAGWTQIITISLQAFLHKTT